MSGAGGKMPELVFIGGSASAFVRREAGPGTLVVSDPFNFISMRGRGILVMARDNDHAQVAEIIKKYEFSDVIAVGGCASLDIGRACAAGIDQGSGKRLAATVPVTVVPTILSTSCISLDRSVLRFPDANRLIKTALPSLVAISVEDMLAMPSEELVRWSQSGFGDLFTMISASIDMQHRRGELTLSAVTGNISDCMAALDWVLTDFEAYDENAIRTLARFLHESSLVVVERDDSALNAAGEHVLYHTLLRQRPEYVSSRPTHGQIVAAGTLVAVRIFCETIKDFSLYDKVYVAMGRLGLPVDYSGLYAAGIERAHLVEGLSAMKGSGTHLGGHFENGDFSVLDRVFCC